MIKAIVTDIEGTTSSIDFVHQVLFPYARKHLADFVRENEAAQDVQEQLAAVERELGEAHLSLDEALAHLMEWMDEDRKLTPLKVLQGLVWEQGYRRVISPGMFIRMRWMACSVGMRRVCGCMCIRLARCRRKSCCLRIRMPAI